MTRYVVSIGSNCGDRRRHVAEAMEWLSAMLSDFRASEIYETPPFGHQGSDYMNAVAEGESEMTLAAFERECKRREVECGRNLYARMQGLVPVDIDIVMADGEVLRPEDFRRGFFRLGYQTLHPEETAVRHTEA